MLSLFELAATIIKESVSVYFDTNPHEGLIETHDVDGSLKEKIKCFAFIPIASHSYYDNFGPVRDLMFVE